MKIVLRIMGGLGNQLFQYAAMRYINLHCPGSKMMIDSGEYKNYKVRKYDLNSFCLIDGTEDNNKAPLFYTLTRKTYHLYQYIYRRITGRQAPMCILRCGSTELMYATIDYSIPERLPSSTLYMYGYFAKEKYIKEIREVLVKDIQLKQPISPEYLEELNRIKNSNNAVGVSIRYGMDYKSLGWPICSHEYYKRAMNLIKKQRGDCSFFIFSDALDQIKSEGWFDGMDVEYVNGFSVPESFMLLKACDDFVIPNSSFAWWASWLASKEDKIVYAPDVFYSDHRYDRLLDFEGELFLNHITGDSI
ncbi:MAG: alpha-1,2-fucosyltransferase [Bacteroidales bacterium]|nr:alpha-1,2-fucosyltransferase [Bacteroidales bacterium]